MSNNIISPALSRYHVQHVCLLLFSLVESQSWCFFCPSMIRAFHVILTAWALLSLFISYLSHQIFIFLDLDIASLVPFRAFTKLTGKMGLVIRLPNLGNLWLPSLYSALSNMSPAFTIKVLRSLRLSCLPISGQWRSYFAQTYMRHHLFCIQPSTLFSHAASCTRKLNTPKSTA